MATGLELITAERTRQVTEEGWTAEHDDSHVDGALAMAAACYAAPCAIYRCEDRYVNQIAFLDPWPWERKWDKRRYSGNTLQLQRDPTHVNINKRLDLLAKAGALIAAEMDRLLRRRERLGIVEEQS